MRRLLAGAVVWALALAPGAHAAEGAELGLLRFSSNLSASLETADPEGGSLATVLPSSGQGIEPLPVLPISWSGDGGFLLVSGFTRDSRRDSSISLYAIPAEGGEARGIPNTEGALFPVGFPDGETVAFERTRGSESESTSVEAGTGKKLVHRKRARHSLWLARIDGGGAQRITPWRTSGFYLPTSVSPDGTTLAVTRVTIERFKRKPQRTRGTTMLLDLRTGRATPVGPNIVDAVFSPDGTRMALVEKRPFAHPITRKTPIGTITESGQTDIEVEDLATGALTQVTEGPADDAEPAWDPSGQRLALVRSERRRSGSSSSRVESSIYEVNPDGSCLTRVLHERNTAFVWPVWRPGAGRAAGPITC